MTVEDPLYGHVSLYTFQHNVKTAAVIYMRIAGRQPLQLTMQAGGLQSALRALRMSLGHARRTSANSSKSAPWCCGHQGVSRPSASCRRSLQGLGSRQHRVINRCCLKKALRRRVAWRPTHKSVLPAQPSSSIFLPATGVQHLEKIC